jgi:hypothetical protein
MMGYLSGRPVRFLTVFASRPAPSIFLTPRQCLPDHLVFIRAGEMQQESFGAFRVNGRKRTASCAPPTRVTRWHNSRNHTLDLRTRH